MNSLTKAKQRYRDQIRDAKKRGIDFLLSFDQWYFWWLNNGVDKNIDTNHSLCMCRFNDVGAYSLDNIYLATRSTNTKDAWNHRTHTYLYKQIQTPDGVFNSRKSCADFYQVDPTTINSWIKTKDSFYYID